MSNHQNNATNIPIIRYPKFRELHQDIRDCIRMSKMSGEPSCMSLEGGTGTGKSTLIRDYSAAFPRTEGKDGFIIPVFYLETPAPVTVKGMASTMLASLGDPAAHYGTVWSMNSRLIQYIIKSHVELVVLDDFHHLIDQKTNRVLNTVSEWLKVLIKETGTPFLVIGIEGQVERILKANSQLSRLFAIREQLTPFVWDTDDEQTIQDFSMFINYAEQTLNVTLSKELDNIELLFRLYYATNGVVANIMNLLRYATMIANDNGRSVITLGILSTAFQKRLAKHVDKPNPFLKSHGHRFTPPNTKPQDSPDSVGNRSRRRKAKLPNINQVLTTK